MTESINDGITPRVGKGGGSCSLMYASAGTAGMRSLLRRDIRMEPVLAKKAGASRIKYGKKVNTWPRKKTKALRSKEAT